MIQLTRPVNGAPLQFPKSVKRIKELFQEWGFNASDDDIEWAYIKHITFWGIGGVSDSEFLSKEFVWPLTEYFTKSNPPPEAETRQITIEP
jgi:hypothetical protein